MTSGFCDADALIGELGAFAHGWNEEPLATEDWAKHLEPNIGLADKKELASNVVQMYESRLDFRQMGRDLSTMLNYLPASEAPDNTASATSGTTAGSPAPSSEATTAQGAE